LDRHRSSESSVVVLVGNQDKELSLLGVVAPKIVLVQSVTNSCGVFSITVVDIKIGRGEDLSKHLKFFAGGIHLNEDASNSVGSDVNLEQTIVSSSSGEGVCGFGIGVLKSVC